MSKTRIQKFKDAYKRFASEVLRSIAKVGNAGRTGDPDKLQEERDRHSALMRRVRSQA